MCVVSNVGDGYNRDFLPRWPNIDPYGAQPFQYTSKQEVEALRQEVKELRELLAAARKFDEATGQKDCEQGEKVKLIKRLAEITGVDLKGVLD